MRGSYYMASWQIRNEILIIGGRKNYTNYMFNPKFNTIRDAGELPAETRETTRFSTLPVQIDNCVYLVTQGMFVLEYNIEEKKWMILSRMTA